MHPGRPNLLILAGLDPSGGAGLLADVRTAEQWSCRPLGCATALTAQGSDHFEGLQWVEDAWVEKQWESALRELEAEREFNLSWPGVAVKVGLISSAALLGHLLDRLQRRFSGVPVVWDPVLAPSAGGEFHPDNLPGWRDVLRQVQVFTPNLPEMQRLVPDRDPAEAAAMLSQECGTAVWLKGGHNTESPGTDWLFTPGHCKTLSPMRSDVHPKHGSGCVASSSVASCLALGYTLEQACRRAKRYTEDYLASSPGLVGLPPTP
jgi:hydroxymethylpyrimidine/phosphomethylpyrimidine kinase